MKLTKSLLSLMVSTSIFAGNLGAPIALPSAKVLPKGVRNLSVKGVMAEGTDKYSNSGEITPLADPFFQPLSFAKILAGTEDPAKAGEIMAAIDKAGVTMDDSFGNTSGNVNLTADVKVPVFAWGLTSKVTAAIAVPIVKTSLNVSTAVNLDNPALYKNMLAQTSLAPAKQEEFIEKMSSPVSEKGKEYGYKSLEDEEETKLGDIKLVTKYKAFENKLNAIVVGAELTLPTGREEDVDKIVDLPGGDGQTDFGVTVNYDLNLSSIFTLSSVAGHTIQFSDTTEKRVPFYRESKLSPYKDDNVDRDLGDISMAQTALKMNYEGLSLGVGYSIQYKQGDEYSGSKYSQTRYDYLGKDSIQRMQNAVATLGYDTISLFKRKSFPVPLSLSVTHSRTFEGKNVVKDPLTTIDMSIFF